MQVTEKLFSSSQVRTVLLVDDNVYWTDTLAAVLRKAGYAVSAVSDGLEAVERLRTSLPDILITDYFLPNLDGGKLCQLAKRLAADLHITTIILTGGADSKLSRRPSPHADAVIAKNTTDVVSKDLLGTLAAQQDTSTPSESSAEVIGHQRLRPRALSTKLHALKQHLDALHEGIGDAVIGVDADRRIYFINSMAVDLLGVPEEAVIARKIDLALGVDAKHPVMRRIHEAFEKTVNVIRPLTVELRSSTLRVTVSCLRNPLGEDSVLLIARDISDLVAAEAERVSLNAQLHAADKMRSLGQMTAGVSHEINNPLAALLPCLELLSERFGDLRQHIAKGNGSAAYQMSELDERVQRALVDIPDLLQDAQVAGRQIKAVVAEMRFFAHPGESKGERAQLDSVLNEAMGLIAREVRFKARLEQDIDYAPTLVVDRALLSQAVLNILINASQAVDFGGKGDDWIRIKTYRSEGGVAVEISNSGPPIPDELALKVFEPFYTTKEPGAGVGLGLSIAYETVRRHGGFIEVCKGTPTTFKIWLPLDTGKALVSIPPLSVPRSEDPVQSVRGRAPPRILIVDDERLVRNGFRRVLDRRYEVALASGGEEAYHMIAEKDYDVILCDLLMPKVTGMQLYQRVLSAKPVAAERFAFLTGGTACVEARDFLQHVGNPRAFKPLDNDELLTFVGRAVRRARMDRGPGVSEAANGRG